MLMNSHFTAILQSKFHVDNLSSLIHIAIVVFFLNHIIYSNALSQVLNILCLYAPFILIGNTLKS